MIAETAAPDAPYTLKIQDMFRAMPYENSLVVLRMNGPQLKQILERAYRNYYYYKYVPGYGGYSYYTTCMLDINAGGKIIYNDAYPATPNGNNVVALRFGDTYVDFRDADTYYNVSTVNDLAAGSCNFNNQGQTLWPLDQVVADTQYYVRDSVIEYVQRWRNLAGCGRPHWSSTARPSGCRSSAASSNLIRFWRGSPPKGGRSLSCYSPRAQHREQLPGSRPGTQLRTEAPSRSSGVGITSIHPGVAHFEIVLKCDNRYISSQHMAGGAKPLALRSAARGHQTKGGVLAPGDVNSASAYRTISNARF